MVDICRNFRHIFEKDGIIHMDDFDLKKTFRSLQQKMIAQCGLSDCLSHPTDKGDNLEKTWLKWFQTYLPKRYKAAKATIIDSNGAKSSQIDIVLYDAQIIPGTGSTFLFFQTNA